VPIHQRSVTPWCDRSARAKSAASCSGSCASRHASCAKSFPSLNPGRPCLRSQPTVNAATGVVNLRPRKSRIWRESRALGLRLTMAGSMTLLHAGPRPPASARKPPRPSRPAGGGRSATRSRSPQASWARFISPRQPVPAKRHSPVTPQAMGTSRLDPSGVRGTLPTRWAGWGALRNGALEVSCRSRRAPFPGPSAD